MAFIHDRFEKALNAKKVRSHQTAAAAVVLVNPAAAGRLTGARAAWMGVACWHQPGTPTHPCRRAPCRSPTRCT